jgi:hypothetical protein
MFSTVAYQSLNISFKQRLVFNLGIDGGFFSEYNNMILAMLYCLENKICFSLYSKNANFKIKDGWNDYFLPFCEEDFNENHIRFNYRMPFTRNTNSNSPIYNYCSNNFVNPFKNSLDPFRDKIKRLMYFKKSTSFNYFTYNLWNKFRSWEMMSKHFSIPELDIEGDLQTACAQLINFTWRYNSSTGQKVHNLIQSVNLPHEYIGFHIRRGDKELEMNSLDIEKYIIKAESISSIRNGFILTDDYKVITELKSSFSNWKFYTLCGEDETGYLHKEFSSKSVEFRIESLIKLFSSIDILNKSNLFVGTFSSNPGMYLGMRRPKDTCVGIDFPSWRIW